MRQKRHLGFVVIVHVVCLLFSQVTRKIKADKVRLGHELRAATQEYKNKMSEINKEANKLRLEAQRLRCQKEHRVRNFNSLI